MAAPNELIPKFQSVLEPYVKPREQVNYIRRILALHLGSCTGDDAAVQPLSVVDSSRHVDPSAEELRGVQKEYAAALQANVAARRQFDAALQAASLESGSRPTATSSGPNFLDGHLALLRLRQKRECLLAVRSSLDHLAEKPASSQSLLDTDKVFRGATALPSVPKAVVNSFVAEKSAAQPDLGSRVHQLEKAVLCAKLQSKQEERLLAEAKTRCKSRSEVVSHGAKLEALNTTRNELISWIEAELSKASAEEADEGGDSFRQGQNCQPEDDQATVTAQLGQISQKYASYVAGRKEVLALASQQQLPSMSPPHQQATPSEHVDNADSKLADHLLTPYIEALLSISSHQKTVISYKSHASSVLKKQINDSRQALDRLAEESQLLPSYPMKSSQRGRSGMANDTTKSSNCSEGISTYIRPWVLAADSAKIATLEAVAETIEGGQIALENCMKSLQDVDRLLGQDTDQETCDTDLAQPSDNVGPSLGGASARKQADKKDGPRQQKGDPWSRLHGNVGLIGHDDSD
ncbi:hypothetical protein HRG_011559 [Hirsutella rhossiliensis]|uniref:Uncharacterized protein n=1 Tax=Hirsutella rhossiliensis TaxID=111463 RepID=A0A9P8MLY0_9HYPO|nr:uncharacterized protein HRG_11559 [Hirsutella rhossiliensis]KAH0957412.1 hypothetical protein HRG_11559 [Hirsutella rhossiliensis]